MGSVRETVNDQLLRLSYKDARNIKSFLRNWGGLESLSLKGDTVATCILLDLKLATGIDTEKYNRLHRHEFDCGYKDGVLSYHQYMSIAYVLVLGYSQEEIAYVMGVSQQMVDKWISAGIRRIQIGLGAFLEE